MRRVLMLPYHFPPDNSGGVPRTVQFVKYLRALGWQATIIAPQWNVPPRDDVGFDAAVPADTEILRVGVGHQEAWPWQALDRTVYFWRFAPMLRGLLQYPGRFPGWLKAVLPVARRILAENRHHAIYSTSPPIISHCIALQLKEQFGLPWVADFRDPWTDAAVGYLTPFRWRRNLDIRLEHRICARADMVLANTSSNRRSMLAKHHLDPERITTITNGYDEACFQGLRPRPDPSRFRIAYSGSFYEPSSVQVFLAAFGKFLAGIEHPRLTLQLAGESCDWPRRYIQDAAVLPHLEFLGYIRHRDVCTMLVNSDLLLAVCPAGTPYWVPGKLYEYLRAGRPIVAVCDRPSEVAAMVEQTGRGRAFRHCEMDDLIAYFRQCYEQWQTGTPTPRFEADESIRAYDRRVLTERLAAILDRLVEESHNGRAAAAPARR